MVAGAEVCSVNQNTEQSHLGEGDSEDCGEQQREFRLAGKAEGRASQAPGSTSLADLAKPAPAQLRGATSVRSRHLQIGRRALGFDARHVLFFLR